MSDLYFIFAVDMKLQKLLRKCDFDKMFEYIVKFDSKSEGSRFAYLVAYELLCDMEAEEGREYDVVPNPYAKESEGPASEIIVWCSVLNLLNLGANKKNVTNLSDFIQNEVWKLVGDAEIKLRK